MCVEAHTAYIGMCMGEHTICVLVSLPAVSVSLRCACLYPLFGVHMCFFSLPYCGGPASTAQGFEFPTPWIHSVPWELSQSWSLHSHP